MELGSFDPTAQPGSQKKPFIATEKRFTWQEMQYNIKRQTGINEKWIGLLDRSIFLHVFKLLGKYQSQQL